MSSELFPHCTPERGRDLAKIHRRNTAEWGSALLGTLATFYPNYFRTTLIPSFFS